MFVHLNQTQAQLLSGTYKLQNKKCNNNNKEL